MYLKGQPMTFGEQIRTIRKEQHMTQLQLAQKSGLDVVTIRKFENGQMCHPRQKTLKKIADALGVDVTLLTESDFDSTKAMQRLFQLFKAYNGSIADGKSMKKAIENGIFDEDLYYISLKDLQLPLGIWFSEYSLYQNTINAIPEEIDESEREKIVAAAKTRFDMWMNLYPESSTLKNYLDMQRALDKINDFVTLHPLNDPENPLSPKEREEYQKQFEELLASIPKKITP